MTISRVRELQRESCHKESLATKRVLPQRPLAVTSSQIQFLEKVVSLVVDDDEGRKILDFNFPDRLHAELRIFQRLDFLDAVLREVRGRASNRGEIKAAVLLAGLAHRRRAVALGQ